MIEIRVSVRFPDGNSMPCGEILCEEPDYRGYIYGEFRYHLQYLEHPLAFPLDPVSLPLKPSVYKSIRPSGVAGVFEDSLPDDWGRKLLVRKHRLPRNRQNPPGMLSVLGDSGLGALSYADKTQIPSEKYAPVTALSQLLDAAKQFETGDYRKSDDISALLKAGSSPGGARPKVLVQDENADLWIAKFPSVKDRYNIVPIEFATMKLAENSGIKIPELKLVDCGGRKVLLVKRFDISEKRGRYHMISFQTLLKADNWYNLSYRDLGSIVRKYSCRPEKDTEALYRQMVFNALIGNTDDHLKNFLMLHTRDGFCLSPAYDLLPDINDARHHVLNFEFDPKFPGRALLIKLGKKSFGIASPEKTYDQIAGAVQSWKSAFEKAGVPVNEIDQLSRSIDARCGGTHGYR